MTVKIEIGHDPHCPCSPCMGIRQTLRSNSRTYRHATTNNIFKLMGCTSWYGHLFQKFNETTLYCPTCGQTRKVAS